MAIPDDEQPVHPAEALRQFGRWLEKWAAEAYLRADTILPINSTSSPGIEPDGPPAHWRALLTKGPPAHWLALLTDQNLSESSNEFGLSEPAEQKIDSQTIGLNKDFLLSELLAEFQAAFQADFGLPDENPKQLPESPSVSEKGLAHSPLSILEQPSQAADTPLDLPAQAGPIFAEVRKSTPSFPSQNPGAPNISSVESLSRPAKQPDDSPTIFFKLNIRNSRKQNKSITQQSSEPVIQTEQEADQSIKPMEKVVSAPRNDNSGSRSSEEQKAFEAIVPADQTTPPQNVDVIILRPKLRFSSFASSEKTRQPRISHRYSDNELINPNSSQHPIEIDKSILQPSDSENLFQVSSQAQQTSQDSIKANPSLMPLASENNVSSKPTFYPDNIVLQRSGLVSQLSIDNMPLQNGSSIETTHPAAKTDAPKAAIVAKTQNLTQNSEYIGTSAQPLMTNDLPVGSDLSKSEQPEPIPTSDPIVERVVKREDLINDWAEVDFQSRDHHTTGESEPIQPRWPGTSSAHWPSLPDSKPSASSKLPAYLSPERLHRVEQEQRGGTWSE